MQQYLTTTFFVLGLFLSACGGNTPPVSDPAAPDTTASPPAPDTKSPPVAPDTKASPVAPGTPDAVATSTSREYIACGCGCCGGEEPVDAPACVSDAELDDIIAKDKQASGCETVGCSQGTRYRVCP